MASWLPPACNLGASGTVRQMAPGRGRRLKRRHPVARSEPAVPDCPIQ